MSSEKQLPALTKKLEDDSQRAKAGSLAGKSRSNGWGLGALFSKSNRRVEPSTSLAHLYKAHHFRRTLLLLIVADFFLIMALGYFLMKKFR